MMGGGGGGGVTSIITSIVVFKCASKFSSLKNSLRNFDL